MKLTWGIGVCVGVLGLFLAGCEEKKPLKSAGGAKSGEKVETPANEEEEEEEPVVEPGGDDVPEEVEVGIAVRWMDEVGNSIKFADNPELVSPDIIAVDASSRDGNLMVVYRFAPGNLEKLFAQKGGDPPLHFGASVSELYLDLDDDAATGAKVGQGEDEQGYELKLSVMTGFGFVDPASGEGNAMFGDAGIPDRMTELKADASRTTWVLDPTVEERGSWGSLESGKRDGEGRRLTILGKDMVVVYVPYGWFGMKSGDVVRVAFTDEKGEDDGMSEVQRVRMK